MTACRLVVFVVVVCCSGAAVGATAVAADLPDGGVDSADGTGANATLVAAYPNPVADDDPGEFVAVRFTEPTNTTDWTLTDGKTTARLPNATLRGTVAFSMAPDRAREHTDTDTVVVELGGRLRLADGGETLQLRRDGGVVDTARYRRAPESEIRDFEAGSWRPVGATDFDPVRTGDGEATVFVLPDAPDVTPETLESADDRLYLAGYTLTSERVADALLAAHDRGAAVRVLLDGSPVGGASRRQARILDRLTDAGIDVRLLDGPHTRYANHHAKYRYLPVHFSPSIPYNLT